MKRLKPLFSKRWIIEWKHLVFLNRKLQRSQRSAQLLFDFSAVFCKCTTVFISSDTRTHTQTHTHTHTHTYSLSHTDSLLERKCRLRTALCFMMKAGVLHRLHELQVSVTLLQQLVGLFGGGAAVRASALLRRRRRRAAAGSRRQVGHLCLVVRVATRIPGCVAALTVGGALRVTGTPQQSLQGGRLVRRHGQLLFRGQHGGARLVGGGAVPHALQHREHVASVSPSVYLSLCGCR